MKKLLFVVLSLVFALAMFAGCGANTPKESEPAATEAPAVSEAPVEESPAAEPVEGADKFRVGILFKTQNNPYFVDLAQKAQQYCEEAGFEVVGNQDAKQDLESEFALMEQYVSQGVDLVLWNPIDPKGSIAAADLCYEAGIPLIGIDNLCQSENMTTTVYSDNKANGYMAGLYVGNNYYKGETINSILLSGEKGNAVGQERRTGLMAGIIGSRAGLDETAAWAAAETMNQELTDSGKAYNEAADFYILGQGWGNWTSEEGLPAAEDLLVANAAKVNLVLGENDNMLLGAMTAIENAGLMDQIYIAAAADGQKEAYKLIQDGTKYIVTGLNAPPVIARGAVDIAIDILVNGVDPDSYELTTTTPPAAITIENVAEFYDPNANF